MDTDEHRSDWEKKSGAQRSDAPHLKTCQQVCEEKVFACVRDDCMSVRECACRPREGAKSVKKHVLQEGKTESRKLKCGNEDNGQRTTDTRAGKLVSSRTTLTRSATTLSRSHGRGTAARKSVKGFVKKNCSQVCVMIA